jgi:hypothetical protein
MNQYLLPKFYVHFPFIPLSFSGSTLSRGSKRRSSVEDSVHPACATEEERETRGRAEGRFRNNARARRAARRRVYFYRAIEARSIDSLQARRKDPAVSERERERAGGGAEERKREGFAHATHGNYRRRGC